MSKSNSRGSRTFGIVSILALSSSLSVFAPVFLALSSSLSICAPVFAQDAKIGAPEDVSITVYNQNFGLVREERNLELAPGVNYLRVEDVAAHIDPTTVSFQSLTAANSVVVREQNYQYDLMDPTTVLSKSVGKELKFKQYLDNGQTRLLQGTLLNSPRSVVSDPSGGSSSVYQGIVVRTPEGIVLNPRGEVELQELPAGLVGKPSLLWKLETAKPGTHKAEISYQTSGLNWHSDYVAILNETDDKTDLTSWVTIDNKSGGTYRNASLKLLAGDVHKVVPQMMYANDAAMGGMAMESAAPPPQFKEQSFAEYHLYALQGKTTVADNETKQLSLFNAADIPVQKMFVYDPGGGIQPYYGGDQSGSKKINVKIELTNSEKNHLGMPMPKGKVRVYKKDQDGALQFIGEDQLDHTPRDEKIRLYIGDAFDLVGEHKQSNYQQISNRVSRASYEISLRNHKKDAVTITCIEHAYGDWVILNSSQPYTKKDSHTFEFQVKVPANGEAKVTYEIETK